MANHQSFLDIFSLFRLFRPFKFVSKTSVFYVPIVGWSMFLTGHIGLKRTDRRSQMACLADCREMLREGTPARVPEVKRSHPGQKRVGIQVAMPLLGSVSDGFKRHHTTQLVSGAWTAGLRRNLAQCTSPVPDAFPAQQAARCSSSPRARARPRAKWTRSRRARSLWLPRRACLWCPSHSWARARSSPPVRANSRAGPPRCFSPPLEITTSPSRCFASLGPSVTSRLSAPSVRMDLAARLGRSDQAACQHSRPHAALPLQGGRGAVGRAYTGRWCVGGHA